MVTYNCLIEKGVLLRQILKQLLSFKLNHGSDSLGLVAIYQFYTWLHQKFFCQFLERSSCYVTTSSTKDGSNHLKQSTIDRFKKVARLDTNLLISDAIISIPTTMRGKRTSDDPAKSIYRFKDANPDYANSAIARIFSSSESTFRGILKRRIGQKKSQIGLKICTHKKNRTSASGPR